MKRNRTAWIFTFYSLNDLQSILPKIHAEDIIIAVDSGIELLLKKMIKPHYFIGDFDSVSVDSLKKVEQNDTIEIVQLKREKDETDAEIAVDFCINKGFEEICLVNSLQERFDHSLGVLSALENAFERGVQLRIISALQEVFLAKKVQELDYPVDTIFSLCPLTEVVSSVKTINCLYPLNHEHLFRQKTRGISNIISKNRAQISFNEGKLLVIVQLNIEHTHLYTGTSINEQLNMPIA
ncbi:MAG TPA: thiamine diphosphokinase [Candidatus Cloacimonadota bacterium]|jgi:thiamine pyrophosphokinase|nr:thiamine diphosphokinase [Candidatus Cloacimonadales bacterium]HPY96960.1 thiamine diphosphokinase [Candidatus Cloacimonadota bacterium]HQB41518.1 thiamine diphosphokinase [Candidatus Cloacimonadota bacterium]